MESQILIAGYFVKGGAAVTSQEAIFSVMAKVEMRNIFAWKCENFLPFGYL